MGLSGVPRNTEHELHKKQKSKNKQTKTNNAETRMAASILKQVPNTQRVLKNAVY